MANGYQPEHDYEYQPPKTAVKKEPAPQIDPARCFSCSVTDCLTWQRPLSKDCYQPIVRRRFTQS